MSAPLSFITVERIDGVALDRLRHLLALLVHGEAVGQDRVVGRAAARAAAFEQRRLEPAAMLVGAFEIEVGGPALLAVAVLEHVKAWVEPLSNQTSRMSVDLLVIVGSCRCRGRRLVAA
jgi:hypothetical protein